MKKKGAIAVTILIITVLTFMFATRSISVENIKGKNSIVVYTFDTLAVVNTEYIRIYPNVEKYEKFQNFCTGEITGIYPVKTSRGNTLVSNSSGKPLYEVLGHTSNNKQVVTKYKFVSLDF